jgi:hypothetical protein
LIHVQVLLRSTLHFGYRALRGTAAHCRNHAGRFLAVQRSSSAMALPQRVDPLCLAATISKLSAARPSSQAATAPRTTPANRHRRDLLEHHAANAWRWRTEREAQANLSRARATEYASTP